MEGRNLPEPAQKIKETEYEEIILNNSETDCSSQETETQKNPHSVYVSSLDDDVEEKEEWPHTCDEKAILKTVPCKSLYEKYVCKTLLLSGSRGKRPTMQSSCIFVVESSELLDSMFNEVVRKLLIFDEASWNTDHKITIGLSNTELERALEYAFLDMCEGEKSEIILHTSPRVEKHRDEDIYPVPCIKCIVHLKKVFMPLETSEQNFDVSLLTNNEEEKYVSALNDKFQGVMLFKKGQIVDAFYRFSVGAKTLMTTDSFLLNAEKDCKDKVLTLFSLLCSNMAECQLRENNPAHSIKLCQEALIYDSKNVKAVYRLALANWLVGDVDQANSLLKRLFELDPQNVAGKQLNDQVQQKISRYNEEYASMMRRIFQPL